MWMLIGRLCVPAFMFRGRTPRAGFPVQEEFDTPPWPLVLTSPILPLVGTVDFIDTEEFETGSGWT